MKRLLASRLVRFGFVGGLGVLVNMLAFALFRDWLQFPDLAARIVAIEIALLHNFAWSTRWVWADREHSSLIYRLIQYHGAMLFGSFVVTIGAGKLAFAMFGEQSWAPYASHLCGIVAGTLSNYLMAEYWVFSKRKT